MASSRIALRYSKSLLDLATTGGKLEEVKSDMEAVSSICAESGELKTLLKSPIISSEDKKAVLSKVFSNTQDITKSFISFLVEKKREDELHLVASNFLEAYNELKGITKATVVSAIALNNDSLAQMKSYVEGLLGKADIELSNEVDPSIIGGIVIKHEDKLLDKSVSKELREIRKQLIYN
ncbi:MAG: ATP synthase F1 subunit delta [Bacteroidia bacterium]